MEKDNGLQAEEFELLGSASRVVCDEVLDDLASEGIAAYTVTESGEERVYADRESLSYARALFRRATAKDEPVDEDAAWEQLVADFDSEARDDDHPWPDAEDVGDEAEPTDEDKESRRRPKVTVIDLDTDDADAPDDDEHYVRPDPPTLPSGDVWTKAAWGVMFAAVAYTIAGLTLKWDVPTWSYGAAVVLFIASIVTHVIRIKVPRSDDTDHGDGAVV